MRFLTGRATMRFKASLAKYLRNMDLVVTIK